MTIFRSLVLSLFLMPVVAAPVSYADTSFTGDLTMSVGGDTISGVIYAAAGYYRMDVTQGRDDFSVIVDRAAGLTRVLIPEKEQYIELKSNDRMTLMNDPFQALVYTRNTAEEHVLGIDTISGYACEKRLLTTQSQELMTYWHARALDFPIKIVNHVSPGTFAEIGFIDEAPVEKSIFDIPARYTKMIGPDNEPAQAPDWAGEIRKAPVVTLPVERNMATGDIIRIRVMPGKSIWVRAIEQSEETMARAIPFKEGWPIKTTTMYTNLAQQGTICTRRNETGLEADEIVVRVFGGATTIQAKYVDMTEQRLETGDSLAYTVTSTENIELRFVNAADGSSECIWEFLRSGIPLPEDEAGAATHRTISLDAEKTVVRRTLSPSGEVLLIRVTAGEFIVKLGQYDSFAW